MSRPIDYEYMVTGPSGPAALLSLVLAGLSNRVLFVPVAGDDSSVPAVLPAVPDPIVASMYHEARQALLDSVRVLPGRVQVDSGSPLRTPGLWLADAAGVVLPRMQTPWVPRSVTAPWYAGCWSVEDASSLSVPNVQQFDAVRMREIKIGRTLGKAIPVQIRERELRVHRVLQLAAGNWDVSPLEPSRRRGLDGGSFAREYKTGICHAEVQLGEQIFHTQCPSDTAVDFAATGRRKPSWTLIAALARGSAWWYDATVGNKFGEVDPVRL